MTTSEHRRLWGQVASSFEALALHLERAAEAFAEDESGSADLAALLRAKEAARQGAAKARAALPVE